MAITQVVQEIHENDIGLVFLVTVKDGVGVVDVSPATLIQFLFQKPNGSVLRVPARPLNDGTDGLIWYATVAGDLDQSGTWKHQVYMEVGSEKKWSNINKFKVFPNIPLPI